MQRKGTQYIGTIFGPVMLLWFGVIALLGLRGVIMAPGIIAAVNPLHALSYFKAGPGTGFAGGFWLRAVWFGICGRDRSAGPGAGRAGAV